MARLVYLIDDVLVCMDSTLAITPVCIVRWGEKRTHHGLDLRCFLPAVEYGGPSIVEAELTQQGGSDAQEEAARYGT